MFMKRTLCLILAIIVMMSLAACGGTTPAATTATATTAATTAAATTAAETTAATTAAETTVATTAAEGSFETFKKFDPSIKVTSVRADTPSSMVTYPQGDDINSNAWTRLYHDVLGVDLKYNWVADSSQYEQKLSMMIASKDSPDFFMVNPIQFQQLVDAGQVEDLTDVWERYASPHTKELAAQAGQVTMDSALINGKMMGIPYFGTPKENVDILYIREDWLTKLGLPEPTTMQDVLTISDAFTHQDPDGNKKDDTYGIAVDKDFDIIQGLLASYHSYPNMWVIDATTGKLVYGGIQPETRNALQVLQGLLADNQINKEFGTIDAAKNVEAIVAGEVGIFYSKFYAPFYPFQTAYNNDPNVKWKWYPVPSIDEKPAKQGYGLGVNGYWVVRKDFENPQILPMMINLIVEEWFYSDNKEDYNSLICDSTGNQLQNIAHPIVQNPIKDVVQYDQVTKLLRGELNSEQVNPDFVETTKGIQLYLDGKDDTKRGWAETYGENGAVSILKYYLDNDLYIPDAFMGNPTPAMVKYNSTLKKLQMETYTKIIKGEYKIEKFDEFIENWKALGGDKVTQEVNDWVDSRK